VKYSMVIKSVGVIKSEIWFWDFEHLAELSRSLLPMAFRGATYPLEVTLCYGEAAKRVFMLQEKDWPQLAALCQA